MIISPDLFNIFLFSMASVAILVFIALHFVTAGYGMMYTRKWGPTIDNRIGWIVMETPVFLLMLWLWWSSDRRFETVPLIIFLLFELHYLQRSFIFPLLIRSSGRMPLSVIVMACCLIFLTHSCRADGFSIFLHLKGIRSHGSIHGNLSRES